MKVHPTTRGRVPFSPHSKLVLFLLLLVPILTPVRAAAALPNLLVNGSFESGLTGWGRAENVAWSPAFGGAARIDQPTHAGFEALVQCVEADGGALYRLTATANLPRRVDGDGGLAVRVRWFASAGCAGGVLRGAPSLDFETSEEVVQSKNRVLVAPDGARSAAVQLVARADTASTYAFVVDEVSLSPEPYGELLTLPTAASAAGARGQRFATDLWVRNAAAVPRRFGIRIACPSPCGPNPEWFSMILGPRETRLLADVVRDALGSGVRDRAGAIEIAYDPREGALEAFARVATSNTDLPGNGTTIPVRTREEARTEAHFIGLSGLGGDAGFRVNAGAFNPNERATTVSVTVRDAAGNDLGSVERVWAAREWFQFNDVLAAVGAPAASAASILVDSGLPIHPFVIAIDNRSGDPAWLEPGPPASRY